MPSVVSGKNCVRAFALGRGRLDSRAYPTDVGEAIRRARRIVTRISILIFRANQIVFITPREYPKFMSSRFHNAMTLRSRIPCIVEAPSAMHYGQGAYITDTIHPCPQHPQGADATPALAP